MDTINHLRVETPIPKTSLDPIDYALLSGLGVRAGEPDAPASELALSSHVGLWADESTLTGLEVTPVLNVEALDRDTSPDAIRLACSRATGEVPEWAEAIAAELEDGDQDIIEPDIELRDYLAHLAAKIEADPSAGADERKAGIAYYAILGPMAGDRSPVIKMGHAQPSGTDESPMDSCSIIAAAATKGGTVSAHDEETQGPRP